MSEISFRIHSLFCGLDKGLVEKRDKLFINENGVVDDYHNDSYIILLDFDTYQIMSQNKEYALCMTKFYPHIVIDKRMNLSQNDVLINKNMKLKVVQCGKRCHMNQGCEYSKLNDVCHLSKYTFYLKSESSGEININEEWGIIKCIDTQ